MIKFNNFRVVGMTEIVVGVVVETADDGLTFKMVEYYINEYNNYLNREIGKFTISPKDTSVKERWKAFKKELGQHVRLKDVYVQEDVVNFLNTQVPNVDEEEN